MIAFGGKGYGSKVETQKKYQSMSMADYNGVRVQKDKAFITVGNIPSTNKAHTRRAFAFVYLAQETTLARNTSL